MAIVLSLLSGVTIVTGRIFNAQLGVRSGVWYSTLMNFFVGLLATLAILPFFGQIWQTPFPAAEVPWYQYLSGAVGVGGIALGAWATTRASGMQMTLVIFISQFFAGLMLDAFCLNKFSPGQLAGGLLVLAGVVLNALADNKKSG